MPFVHVELVEGRTEEQSTNMIKDTTEAVSKNAGAPKENIHVIVNELKKNRYARGGEWKKQVFREFLLNHLPFLKISG